MPNLASASTHPRCFISYSHDSEDHKRRVLALAEELRNKGVDVMIDRYVESTPIRNLPIWMDNEVAAADFVLVVATETYFTRFMNKAKPGEGLGARWEGAIISTSLYEERGETSKFIPVIFEDSDVQFIPTPLRQANRHNVSSAEGCTKLLRQLHGAPEIAPGPIGANPFLSGGEADNSESAPELPPEDKAASEDRIRELKISLDTADREHAIKITIEIGDLRAKDELYTEALTAYRRASELSTDPVIRQEVALKFRSTFERMQARFGEGGPVDAVNTWVEAVRNEDFDSCWRMIEPKMRLVLAQAWIIANRHRSDVAPFYKDDSVANALSAFRSDHRLSAAFRATQMREFQTSYGFVDPELWGAAERPRRFGIDLELIILMKNDNEPFVWEPGKKAPSVAFVVRWIHGTWYIASFGTDLSEPGWPPVRKPLPFDGIAFRPDDPS